MKWVDLRAGTIARRGLLACTAVATILVACQTDRLVSSGGEISAIDGRPLDSKVMANLRNEKQGCAFTIPNPSGGIRMLGLYGKRLPFTPA